jgi:hypothetical protein
MLLKKKLLLLPILVAFLLLLDVQEPSYHPYLLAAGLVVCGSPLLLLLGLVLLSALG